MGKILPEEEERTIHSEIKQKLPQENFLVNLGLSPLFKDCHLKEDDMEMFIKKYYIAPPPRL